VAKKGTFARYRTDVETLERVGRSTCGTKISQRIRPVDSLLISSETIQPLVDLLALLKYVCCLRFAVTFCVLGSPLLLPLPANSVFRSLCPSVIKPRTGGFFNYFFLFLYLVRNIAAYLWLIQFRDSEAYTIICPLATPSCDCSAANRPRLKSADTCGTY